MDYQELFDAVQSYTENNFPTFDLADESQDTTTEQINRFIKQAEQRIYNTVQFPSLRKNVTGNTSLGNKYLSAPTDFLAVYSLAAIDPVSTEYLYLLNKDVNYIREAYPSPTDSGKPRYYALFGPTTTSGVPPVITNELTFLLGPTPDNAYTMELHYYYYPESITTAASGQTWLGDNFDSVLLYGTLVEAYTYMKGEQDVMAFYEAKYKEALGLAKRLGDGMERGDAYRDGQIKIPVT
jgi:hypothetical protein